MSGQGCDLRRGGMQLAEGGGKNAKKRAIPAVARKLAVLWHKLWVSGEVDDPPKPPPGRSPRSLVRVRSAREECKPRRSPRSGDCWIGPAPGPPSGTPESDPPVAAPTATRNAQLAPSKPVQ